MLSHSTAPFDIPTRRGALARAPFDGRVEWDVPGGHRGIHDIGYSGASGIEVTLAWWARAQAQHSLAPRKGSLALSRSDSPPSERTITNFRFVLRPPFPRFYINIPSRGPRAPLCGGIRRAPSERHCHNGWPTSVASIFPMERYWLWIAPLCIKMRKLMGRLWQSDKRTS